MRRILLALATGVVGVAMACATSTKEPFNEGLDASDDGNGNKPDGQNFNGDSSQNEGQACASGTYEAKQAPAAMLVLLQRSGSMATSNKYAFAAQAIVSALDQNSFDNMTLGLLAAPSAMPVKGPACVMNLPVGCGVSPFPNVDLINALQLKSIDSTGVRHSIKQYLNTNGPDMTAGDGNPLYDAINLGIGALKGWNGKGKRILFVVTDGGISCTSLSSRTANAFSDANGCNDWENPNAIMGLVQAANLDMNTPVDTFVVGVPGSDTYDATGASYPPYHMRAALSDIAALGSPANVPMGCNSSAVFHPTKMGDVLDPDPVKSCHFDMTQNNYSTQAVADAISAVRGKVLGCIFDVPQPDGGTVDASRVNVDYQAGMGPKVQLYKRKDMSNACTTDGCWDYTADGKIQLIGKACDDLKANLNAKVNISVGCETVVK